MEILFIIGVHVFVGITLIQWIDAGVCLYNEEIETKKELWYSIIPVYPVLKYAIKETIKAYKKLK